MGLGYKVKEIYYTIQGEGFHTGRPAIFCRFTGCNLWSGREEDRHSAVCSFCDTDFVGMDGQFGGKYSAAKLRDILSNLWPNAKEFKPFVVFTGGEPLLQLDQELIDTLLPAGFEISIETNGSLEPAFCTDDLWITVSPKAGAQFVLKRGSELKLVYPQKFIDPKELEVLDFDHFFLQPLDDEAVEDHTATCLKYCLEHPKWKLSLQTHKILGIK